MQSSVRSKAASATLATKPPRSSEVTSKNGKEYNYSPDSEVPIPPTRTRVLDEVKENSLNGNNQGIDWYNMITSFFTFQGISSFDSKQCGEGLDRPMCDKIKCIATHDTFEEPISQYFMLVYERPGNGNGCC